MQRPETCTVEKCKRPYRAKGYCRIHYKKWRRGELSKTGRYKTCGREDCRKPMAQGGLCADHFRGGAAKPADAAPAAPTA